MLNGVQFHEASRDRNTIDPTRTGESDIESSDIRREPEPCMQFGREMRNTCTSGILSYNGEKVAARTAT